MHKDAEHVARAYKAAVKERKARQCHEKDQRRRDHDPSGICTVHYGIPPNLAKLRAFRADSMLAEKAEVIKRRLICGQFRVCLIFVRRWAIVLANCTVPVRQ